MASSTTSSWHSHHALSRSGRKKIRRSGLGWSWSLVGLLAVAALALVAATLMLRFMPERMLREEALLTIELVRSAVLPKKPVREIGGASDRPSERTQPTPEPMSPGAEAFYLCSERTHPANPGAHVPPARHDACGLGVGPSALLSLAPFTSRSRVIARFPRRELRSREQLLQYAERFL